MIVFMVLIVSEKWIGGIVKWVGLVSFVVLLVMVIIVVVGWFGKYCVEYVVQVELGILCDWIEMEVVQVIFIGQQIILQMVGDWMCNFLDIGCWFVEIYVDVSILFELDCFNN